MSEAPPPPPSGVATVGPGRALPQICANIGGCIEFRAHSYSLRYMRHRAARGRYNYIYIYIYMNEQPADL